MGYPKEREAVKGAYRSLRWKKRIDNMSDNQVLAIYMRLRTQGKI